MSKIDTPERRMRQYMLDQFSPESIKNDDATVRLLVEIGSRFAVNDGELLDLDGLREAAIDMIDDYHENGAGTQGETGVGNKQGHDPVGSWSNIRDRVRELRW